MSAAAASSSERSGIITACVMLATIMQALDTTIANIALPYMQGSLSATQDQVSWVLTSYIVAAAIMTPVTGFLAGRFGRKRLFVFMVLGFTVASMLCGAAQSIEEMVLFRLLQGIFGAPLVPMSQSVLLDSYPKEKHGSAMAMWGVGVMVGPIMGPVLGGWLTENYDWRWVFYINLPLGILTAAGLWIFLSESKAMKTAFDWIGFLTLGVFIGALQMMLDRGQQLDWFASMEIVLEGALAALALYLFIAHSLTTRARPFIDLRLFQDSNFVAGLLFIFTVGIILLASLALLTPYLQNLMGFPVVTAGLLLGPRGLGTMAAMMIVGRLINKVDPRYLVTFGLVTTIVVLGEMQTFTPDISQSRVVWNGVAQGLGLGFMFVPLSTIAFSTLLPELRAQGTALFSLVRNIGSSIGISIVFFLLTRNATVMHESLAGHVTPFNDALRHPEVSRFWSLGTAAGRAALDAEVTRQAVIVAYADDFRFMMFVAMAALPLLLLLKNPRKQAKGPPPAGQAAAALE